MPATTSALRIAVTACAALIALSATANAGEVKEIRGAFVLFTSDIPAKVSDVFSSIDAEGAETSEFQVVRVKGSRAIGRITGGKPVLGQEVVVAKVNYRPKPPPPPAWPAGAWVAGLSIEHVNAPVNVTAISSATVPIGLTGTALGVSLGIESFAADWIAFDLKAGFQYVSASVTDPGDDCNGSPACFLKLGYLQLLPSARIFPVPSWHVRPYFGVALDIDEPVIRSSNAVNASSINLSFFKRLSVGLQVLLRNQQYLQFEGDYATLSTTSTSTAMTMTGFHAGYAWEW